MSDTVIKSVTEIFSNFKKFNSDKFLYDHNGALVDPEVKHTHFGQKRVVAVPFMEGVEITMRDIACLDNVLYKEILVKGLVQFDIQVDKIWIADHTNPFCGYQMVIAGEFEVEEQEIGEQTKLGQGYLYKGKTDTGRDLEFVLYYLQDPTMPGESFLKLVSGPENPLRVEKVYGYTLSIKEK